MSPILSAEIVLGMLLVGVVLPLTFIFIRRRVLASGPPLVLCAVRRDPSAAYSLGLLRFGGETLEFFGLFGPSLRPRRTFERGRFDLDSPSVATTQIAGIPDAVEVGCYYGTERFGMALAPGAYTAVRTWLESAPPGYNVNVA